MATVAGIYHLDRPLRCPRPVARQWAPLRLVPPHQSAAPKPVAKRLWASLEQPMKAGIAASFEEGGRRDPTPQADWVAWVDGAAAPIDYIKPAATKSGVAVVLLLEIIHRLEYLGKATNT